MPRRGNPLALWLAVIATVLNLVWPLLAQARMSARVLVPVCTVEGVTHYLELPTGKTPLQGYGEHKHCSVCAVAAQPATAPSCPAFVRPPGEGQAYAAREPRPVVSFQYPAAQSRAPPHLSKV